MRKLQDLIPSFTPVVAQNLCMGALAYTVWVHLNTVFSHASNHQSIHHVHRKEPRYEFWTLNKSNASYIFNFLKFETNNDNNNSEHRLRRASLVSKAPWGLSHIDAWRVTPAGPRGEDKESFAFATPQLSPMCLFLWLILNCLLSL